MSEKKCKTCGSSDLTAGGRCRPCKKQRNQAYQAKPAGGGRALVKREAAPAPKVQVDAGFGFIASIENGYLQVQQANNEGEITDTVVLSKAEARRLFEEFKAWAG